MGGGFASSAAMCGGSLLSFTMGSRLMHIDLDRAQRAGTERGLPTGRVLCSRGRAALKQLVLVMPDGVHSVGWGDEG